jgi:hypothetical protein
MVLDGHDLVHESPMPNIGRDLIAEATALCAEGIPVERFLAVLELLRHQEITLDQAVAWSGHSQEQLVALLGKYQSAI